MDDTGESLLDLFIFETSQNIEQLERIMLDNEKSSGFTIEAINEIFRVMHTIKGSAAMMMFHNLSTVAHSAEDLFYYIREHADGYSDYGAAVDLALESLDFIRSELEKIKAGSASDGDGSSIVSEISDYLARIKGAEKEEAHSQKACENEKEPHSNVADGGKKKSHPTGENTEGETFKAHVFFEEGCLMESIRAFDVINRLSAFADVASYVPDDIMDNDDSACAIREKGFEIYFKTDKGEQRVRRFFEEVLFIRELNLERLGQGGGRSARQGAQNAQNPGEKNKSAAPNPQKTDDIHNVASATMINVHVLKLDKLMDLVGEMVISEAMVVQNPDLKGLELENFKKSARQLHKITSEIQDTVMSIRMVPLADIFQKMHRIVRDMSKKLNKQVRLEMVGEETEVDKNIIKHLSDPLMHLMRNAIDHGIEDIDERGEKGKPETGTVTLEAKNEGNDVLVIVRDDGRGLSKEGILAKAKKNGLLKKNTTDMTEKEIFNLIFIPGFSTNENITEYSGRGVGMDVVAKSIEEVGGSVSVDSAQGGGTAITIKIPLTLAIIDGMNVRVGTSRYTIPTIGIKESFRPREKDLIVDPDGNEMVMVRGQCYAVVRLHRFFNVKTEVTEFTDGIFVMVEQYGKMVCLFADELIGQQQVVVKAMPSYIKNIRKIHGITGCTLLGDGGISLILDIGWLTGLKK